MLENEGNNIFVSRHKVTPNNMSSEGVDIVNNIVKKLGKNTTFRMYIMHLLSQSTKEVIDKKYDNLVRYWENSGRDSTDKNKVYNDIFKPVEEISLVDLEKKLNFFNTSCTPTDSEIVLVDLKKELKADIEVEDKGLKKNKNNWLNWMLVLPLAVLGYILSTIIIGFFDFLRRDMDKLGFLFPLLASAIGSYFYIMIGVLVAPKSKFKTSVFLLSLLVIISIWFIYLSVLGGEYLKILQNFIQIAASSIACLQVYKGKKQDWFM